VVPLKRCLPAVLGAALVAVGTSAVIAPSFASRAFGLPSDDPIARAFMRAAGVRDLIIGGIVLGSLGDRPALRRTLGWTSLIGLADAITIFGMRGPALQHVGHVGGFVTLAVAALILEP
jgi:hypothetical protein